MICATTFFFDITATTWIYTLSLHDALPIFKVPVLAFGTGTFGGQGEFFRAWGATDVAEARRLLDICLDRKSTRLNSSHVEISYAVFCLKKKMKCLRKRPQPCFT